MLKQFSARRNRFIQVSLLIASPMVLLWLALGSELTFASDPGTDSEAPKTTLIVTTPTDELNADGDCSLREAIRAANLDVAVDACPAGNGADTINVPAGVYTLTLIGAGEDATLTGDLDITSTLTINGASAATTIIDGNASDRVFDVLAGGITIGFDGLTIVNGFVSGSSGGAIRNPGSTVNFTNSTLLNNSVAGGGGGGAIATNATLNIANSLFSNNGGGGTYGGAIFNSAGMVNITGSVFLSNTSSAAGGGAIINLASLNITNSTFSGNAHSGTDGGGAIYNDGGTASISGSTFTHNSTNKQGGAIMNGGGFGTSPLTIVNSTFLAIRPAHWAGRFTMGAS